MYEKQIFLLILQNYLCVLNSADAKKIIRNYNRVAQVLLEYEILYHSAWVNSVDACREGTLHSLNIFTIITAGN